MRNFAPTKYFLRKITKETKRFDVEFLDPRHEELEKYLNNIKKTKNLEIEPINELCDAFSGKTAGKYVEYGVPIIKLRNVTGRGIDWETDYVDETFLLQNKELQLAKNDILLTSTGDGTIGRADIYESDVAAITDGHVTVLRMKNNKVSSRYLLYYMRSKLGQIQVERHIVGSTGQTELNDPDIKNILIAHPMDPTDRERIVCEVTDAEREATRNEAAVDRELSKIDGILSQVLGFEMKSEQPKTYASQLTKSSERMDFVFNSPFFKEYDIATRKSKYPFVELKELVSFSSETVDPMEKPDEQFLYVDIGNIDTRWGAMHPEPLMGYEATSARMRRLIHSGQLLVSTTRPTRRAISIVPEELDGQVCSTGFAVLECNTRINNEYLFHVMRSKIMTYQFKRFSSGAGYPEINKENDLPRIRVPCPDDKEIQEQIVRRVNAVVLRAHKLYDQANQKWQQATQLFEDQLT